MNFYEFYNLLEMGMANISHENSEVITIRKGSKKTDDDGYGPTGWSGSPIYITIYKDSSLNDIIVSAEVLPVIGTKYYNLHINASHDYIGKGYGPLLYEVAIEYVTLKKGSLIPSIAASTAFEDKTRGGGTGSTSEQAANVFKKFYNRSDVEKKPLETNNPEIKEYYEETPWLFSSYQKQPTTIQNLKTNKKLFIDQEINKIHDFIHSDNLKLSDNSKDEDMQELVKNFIERNPELKSRYEDLISKREHKEIQKLENLIYAYIRRFFQIKDQDYVKEKNIIKYSWKNLVDIVDYRGNKKLFGDEEHTASSIAQNNLSRQTNKNLPGGRGEVQQLLPLDQGSHNVYQR
jgi:hypothetical protein